ncbi:MAG: alpha/beta hydrolase [Propionibacteriaceae bacterium]
MTTTHFVLVPGNWLGAWAWDRVTAPLQAGGHQVTAVTLPGLTPTATDRGSITLSEHLDALADVVSHVGPDAVLVAHSGAGKNVSGVLDRDPASVRRVIYVDSGPAATGLADDLPPELAELPLPSWDEFAAQGSSLEGLSPEDLAEFAARAVPHPAGPLREPIVLQHDEARRAVPTTIVACSISSTVVDDLAHQGHPMFAEVAQLVDLTYLDLPTGHWPMWSRPVDLADALMRSVTSGARV